MGAAPAALTTYHISCSIHHDHHETSAAASVARSAANAGFAFAAPALAGAGESQLAE